MDPYVKYLLIILLLPMIPAFLLYKIIPSRTDISGPFQGLQIKLGGAFGGYFLLLLVIFLFMKPPQGNWEIWTVNGQIKLSDDNILLEDFINLRLKPATYGIDSEGNFSLKVLRTTDQTGALVFPQLILEYSGYIPYRLDLDRADKEVRESKQELNLCNAIVLEARPDN